MRNVFAKGVQESVVCWVQNMQCFAKCAIFLQSVKCVQSVRCFCKMINVFAKDAQFARQAICKTMWLLIGGGVVRFPNYQSRGWGPWLGEKEGSHFEKNCYLGCKMEVMRMWECLKINVVRMCVACVRRKSSLVSLPQQSVAWTFWPQLGDFVQIFRTPRRCC